MAVKWGESNAQCKHTTPPTAMLVVGGQFKKRINMNNDYFKYLSIVFILFLIFNEILYGQEIFFTNTMSMNSKDVHFTSNMTMNSIDIFFTDHVTQNSIDIYVTNNIYDCDFTVMSDMTMNTVDIYFSPNMTMNSKDIYLSDRMTHNSIDVYLTDNPYSADYTICFPSGGKYDYRHVASIVALFIAKDD